MSDSNLSLAAERVDYRLTYDRTDTPRRCHSAGINGPQLPNAYFGRANSKDDSEPLGSGDWEDPEHPQDDAPQAVHIDRWFVTAVRESIHEALEWFWVDGETLLDPHGEDEDAIHKLSGSFAERLLALRQVTP